MMNCLISWSPRLRLCHHRDVDVDPSSPCDSPSSYAAQTQSSVHLRSSGDVATAASGGSVSGTTTTTTRKFTLAQLSAATGGFRDSNLVGEGGFGRVYRGRLEAAAGGDLLEVAVKQLCRGGAQGSREFLVECSMLMMLRQPNLVSLVGYCAEAQERLLVYEFLPWDSLDAHLFTSSKSGLGWDARGLRYLHEVVTPPVIYRDLKSSNILLGDDDLSPKLSDFGLARLGPDPEGDDTHVSTRVMGTYGYCAPDYAVTGKLSVKSDVYSFGVVLLELLTGRRAFDAHSTNAAARESEDVEEERRLLVWARPHLQQLQGRGRGRCLEALADPALQGRYPRRGLYQVAVIASLCLHDKPNLRPTMTDVTQALEHVASSRDRDGDREEAAGAGGGSSTRGRGGTPRASSATADDSWRQRTTTLSEEDSDAPSPAG